MLRVVGDAIAMHGLLWPDEVRAPRGVAPDADVTVRDKELDLADALMDTLGEVDLEDLHDEYREAVEEVVAAKAAGEAPREAPAPEAGGGKVLDLMAALENSVRAARESRGEEPAEDAEVKRLPTQDVPLVPEGHGRQEVDVDGEEEDDVVASEVDVEDVAGREEEHDEEDGGEEDPGEEDNVPQTLGLTRLVGGVAVGCLRRRVAVRWGRA